MFTKREEVLNATLHGIGFLLAIACLVILIVFSAKRGNAWNVVSAAIYGSTLVILFLSSTLCHSFSFTKYRDLFLKIDFVCIYLLIAGTYTPFTLVSLRGGWGWSLFGVVWGLALAGLAFKLYFGPRYKFVSTIVYIILGWVMIIALKPLLESINILSFIFLVAGGIVYSLGTYFFLTDDKEFHHAIWHLFVLAGSALQFLAVWYAFFAM